MASHFLYGIQHFVGNGRKKEARPQFDALYINKTVVFQRFVALLFRSEIS